VEAPDVSTPGSVGTYGDVFCVNGIGRNAGVANGWQCDPNRWYLDPVTGAGPAPGSVLALVGNPFELRDADCYDTTLMGARSTLNPTHADVGPRAAAPLADATHGCW
jgi:hypothetical protein